MCHAAENYIWTRLMLKESKSKFFLKVGKTVVTFDLASYWAIYDSCVVGVVGCGFHPLYMGEMLIGSARRLMVWTQLRQLTVTASS